MDAERRAELHAEVCMMEDHEDSIPVPIADLRALLADSKAAEEAGSLPELLEGRARCNQQRSDASSRAEVYRESAHLIRKSLGRDP